MRKGPCSRLLYFRLTGNSPAVSAKGFILIELIVVLFLISIIMGITVVYFANLLPSSKFESTVRTIASTIKHARSLSRINNQAQTVTIDLDSKKYGIEGVGSKDIPENVNVKIIDPFSGEISRGKYHFIVHIAGNIEGGDIMLWNASKSRLIRIDPVIGAVVIK